MYAWLDIETPEPHRGHRRRSRYNRRVSYNIATFDENKIGKVSLNLFRVIARGLITGSRVVALAG